MLRVLLRDPPTLQDVCKVAFFVCDPHVRSWPHVRV